MGVFGSKGGLQDHGPIKDGAQTRLKWVAAQIASGKTKVVQPHPRVETTNTNPKP